MSNINREMAVALDKLIEMYERATNLPCPSDIRRVAEQSRRELTPDYHTEYCEPGYMGQG